MDNTENPTQEKRREFVKVQKNGPKSISIGVPKTIATNLRILKGTYVMIYQLDDRIIIEKVN
ncbi:hypothetical protein BH23THE1_BH23THE1_20520 [soil metagenome]